MPRSLILCNNSTDLIEVWIVHQFWLENNYFIFCLSFQQCPCIFVFFFEKLYQFSRQFFQVWLHLVCSHLSQCLSCLIGLLIFECFCKSDKATDFDLFISVWREDLNFRWVKFRLLLPKFHSNCLWYWGLRTVSILVIWLHLVKHSHLDFKVLHQHWNCVFILLVEWHDYIGVFHCGLYELIVSRLDKTIVLFKNINNSSTSFRNITLN